MSSDGLSHLDFEPEPMLCGCQGCPAVPHTRDDPPCGRPAVSVVKVHAVNDCGRQDLSPDGGLIQLCCATCTSARTEQALQYQAKLRRFFHRFKRAVACNGCGRPLVDMGDFIEVSRLEDVLAGRADL